MAAPRRGRGHPKIAARLARDVRERRRLETARSWGVSPNVYDGAPIVERHYDADGKLAGFTEHESPWDDAARTEAEALWESEQLFCPSCGNLREDCSNPDFVWYPQRHICYATRQQAAADRQYGNKHNERAWHDGTERRWQAEEDKRRAPFHYRDGVRVYVAPVDMNPEDNFL